MSEQALKYTLLGDEDGNFLPQEEIEEKVRTAADAISKATDPDSMHAAIEGMSAADVQFIVDQFRDQIGSANIMRIHGCMPVCLNESFVRRSAESVVDTYDVIPSDIKPMVEGWAADKIRNQMVQQARRSMNA